MTERQIKLILGSLLHDVGKVVYRSGDGRNHSQSGYDFLKEEAGIQDQDVLNCVRYHHGVYLSQGKLEKDSLAYITYIADNIAAAADRRESEDGTQGFDKSVPLSSIFNILNGKHGKYHYEKKMLNADEPVNYPTEQPIEMDETFYQKVRLHLKENLQNLIWNDEYINSVLQVMEANLSYIPSSTSRKELADISLYDHSKMTAAIGSCIEQYLKEIQKDDYRDELFVHAEKFYKKKVFLLYSMDISGIQNFIYTISSNGALRGLRARSFYLEILMEHVIDELLAKLSLSRANLIYSGGGHCYLLLANTDATIAEIERYEEDVNNWFIQNFGTTLFIGCGYAPCSAQNLRNVPEGSYGELYSLVSRQISDKKMHRYSAQQIRQLNTSKVSSGERECCVCRRVDKLDSENRCPICAALYDMSADILHRDFFLVTEKKQPGALPLPMDRYLMAGSREQVIRKMEQSDYVRCYTKNRSYTGKHVATKLWCGAYTSGDTFDEFAAEATGIERIAVLRADVDNLGTAFVSGFHGEDDRYATLSRTASLSRQLSLFFKYNINQILGSGQDSVLSYQEKRKVTIVYSGGDDVFLVGSWDAVIESAIDLHNAFARFTQGALTFSCGIGIYKSGYPINVMAKEVEQLEASAKNLEGKNAISLFDENMTFYWQEFLNQVLNEKYAVIKEFFASQGEKNDGADERGMAFLYHLTGLIQNSEDSINMARYVYLLARMEPDEDSPQETKTQYRRFSAKMYQWWKEAVQTGKRNQILIPLYLYSYVKRKEGETEDETE